MSPSNHISPVELDEQSWAVLAAAVAAFEAVWKTSAKVTLREFIPDVEYPLRTAILAELVKVDQEFRFRRGELRQLETYLQDWPELSEPETTQSLLDAECLTRALHATVPTRDELRQRFPEFAESVGLEAIVVEAEFERSQISNRGTIIFQQAEQDTSPVPAGILSPAERDDELGRLGTYRILDVLGAGGMGVVFLAEDERLDRKVAIKTLRANLAGSREFRRRFLREARAAAGLSHDHIVTIHQVGEANGVPFLAMPLLEGETLEERLCREGVIAQPEVFRIGSEIADALAAAHQIGLVHRDIKPANVWLERGTARVKLLDFGLACSATERVDGDGAGQQSGTSGCDRHAEQLTGKGERMGTPAYMAPEQTLGDAVDARSDLFSLGCVLYRMATGELPFAGSDVLNAGLTGPPIPPKQRNTRVPGPLDALICRLLARRPQDRPSTAAAVHQELRQAKEGSTRIFGSIGSRTAAALIIGILVLGALLQLVRSLPQPVERPENASLLVGRDGVAAARMGFGLTRHYDIGVAPFDVAAGDLDGDGILDLVASNMFDDSVSVLAGKGDGSFGEPVFFAANVEPHTIALGDYDEDQRLDIAVAALGSNSVTILLGDGSGHFTAGGRLVVGLAPRGLATADLDGDGHLDLVASNSRSNDLSFLFGAGDGTFGPAISHAVERSPVAVEVGDFNNDSLPDIVSSNGGDDSISLLLGLGKRRFEPARHRRHAGIGPGMLAIADYDQDGWLDVAVESFGTSDVTILLGDGDGSFRQGEVYPVGLGPGGIEVADFNNDGNADLIVANHNSRNVSLLLGRGDGRFRAAQDFLVGDTPVGIAVGDFDRDQRPDFAVANHWSDNLSVRLSQPIRAHFSVQAPNQLVEVNGTVQIRVTVRGTDGRLRPDYLGTVRFASDDPRASLPEPYTFRADDNGDRVFRMSFLLAGPRTIEVRDETPDGPVGGTVFMIQTGTRKHLKLTLDVQQNSLIVQVVDRHENLVTDYAGRVRIETAGSQLIQEHTFNDKDRGRHSFTLQDVQRPNIIQVSDVADPSLSAEVRLEGAP